MSELIFGFVLIFIGILYLIWAKDTTEEEKEFFIHFRYAIVGITFIICGLMAIIK